MPFQSKRTVKVYNIPSDTTKEHYLSFVKHLCTAPTKGGVSSWPIISSFADTASALNSDSWTKTTFATQNGQPVGTISFLTSKAKFVALMRHKQDDISEWKDWIVSDDFRGITILYQDERQVNVDICMVHGLGSNAIDAWTTKDGKMWPRDLLPTYNPPASHNFAKSRIMTFGYDSDLTDSSTVMTMENWAESLVYLINEVRTSDVEKTRPLLLVCHSMGGLVARKALAQLPATPNCAGITLSRCGIIFLATPHTGTTKADWDNFLVSLASVVAGIRPETVNSLRAFNSATVWDQKSFLNLSPRPPFRCFAEGSKMLIKWTKQYIVTQASASLDSQNPARMIMGADHNSICKFNSSLGYFVTVASAMSEVLTEVNTPGEQQGGNITQQGGNNTQQNESIHGYAAGGGGSINDEAIKSLDFTSMDFRTFFLGNRVPNITTTGLWINSHFEYNEWIKAARGPLWIKGKPGSGKSTLMYCLFRRLEQQLQESNDIVLHFFFSATQAEKLQRSEFGLYRTLLYQLLSKVPKCLAQFGAKYGIRKKTKRERGENGEYWHEAESSDLRNFLIDELRGQLSLSRKVFIFVDAIDEAFSDSIADIIRGLHEMDKTLRAIGAPARMCISSRHFPVIPYRQQHSIVMEKENQKEIQNYITTAFEEAYFPRRRTLTNDGTLAALVQDLLERSRGLWLWVFSVLTPVLDDLNRAEEYATIVRTMERIPPRLGEIYSGILEDIIAPNDRNRAYQLLKWGVDHDEPWSLAYMSKSTLENKTTLNMEAAEVQIGIFTGGLMELIAWDPTHLAMFIHPTVKTYLADHGLSRFEGHLKLQEFRARNSTTIAEHRSIISEQILDSDAEGFEDLISAQEIAPRSLIDYTWVVNPESDEDVDQLFKSLELFPRVTIQPGIELQSERYRVKIAVIDTGLDTTSLDSADIPASVHGYWAPEGINARKDPVGHGTYIASLIGRVAPDAELYIARISSKLASSRVTTEEIAEEIAAEIAEEIAEAIYYAVHDWKVDIIYIGFSFDKAYHSLKVALNNAAIHHISVFAPAATGGRQSSKQRLAFPARNHNVIAINSADRYGNTSIFNPPPLEDHDNFAIMGESVKGPWLDGSIRHQSGTSVATAIAVGMFALILRFARLNLSSVDSKLLQRPETLRILFRYFGKGMRDGFRLLVPWTLWQDSQDVTHELLYVIRQSLRSLEDD